MFPSNAQPERYENTAAEFETDLTQPIDLNGDWEVALQDLSYVNNIRTIANEEITLGTATNQDLYFPKLERNDKVHTYNLNEHAAEWNSIPTVNTRRGKRAVDEIVNGPTLIITADTDIPIAKNASPLKWKQPTNPSFRHRLEQSYYYMKIQRLLNVMNDLAKDLWFWQMDPNLHKVTLYMRPTTISHGFYVSGPLQKILNLKSRFFLPITKFAEVKGGGAFPLRAQVSMKVSKQIKKYPNWHRKKFNITLLPLDRMHERFVLFKSGTVDDLIKQVNEINGLSMSITRVHNKARIDFRNDYERSHIGFVHINSKFRDLLSLKTDVLWSYHEWGNVKITSEQQSDCRMVLYFKRTDPVLRPSLTWKPNEKLPIPPKHYSNGYDVCTYLNKGVSNLHSYHFDYDPKENTFCISVHGKTVIHISKELTKILGFKRDIFYDEKYCGSTSLLDMNINHFYIYTNFIHSTQVGGQMVPLLRYIPIDSGDFGVTMHREFLNKVYIPVNVSRLSHCKFGIYDDSGNPIQFIGGRTVLTLHFRQITSNH